MLGPPDPAQEGYTSFAPLFEFDSRLSVVPYMYLFAPARCELSEGKLAFDMVEEAIRRSPDAPAEVAALFNSTPWRSNIVGAIAVVLGVDSPVTLSMLWHAFDRGSWVTPQLAVAAALRDPNFEAQARARIVDDYTEHSAKTLAALIEVCKKHVTDRTWLDVALEDPARRQAAMDTSDRGGEIVQEWEGGLQAALSHTGTSLRQANRKWWKRLFQRH